MLYAYRKEPNKITQKVWLKLESAERAAGISLTLPVTAPPDPFPSASSSAASAASAPLRFASSSEAELLAVLLRIAAALERLAGTGKEDE